MPDTRPCSPDGGTLQEFIDSLPGYDQCCYHMTGVKVRVRRVIEEEVDLCVPTPDDADTLKYVESIMALALPLVPTTIGTVYQVLGTTPTWEITESFR